MTEPILLKLDSIRLDGGTQPRAKLDQLTIDQYADDMQNGATFPPVIVFCDGRNHWLADGFHRYHAARQAGRHALLADIRSGAQREAILYSVGANSTHGLNRTNEDKRQAVLTLLSDVEWGKWSNREIARQCGVSDQFVNNLRNSLPTVGSDRVFRCRQGLVTTMRVSKIGGKIAPGVRAAIRDTHIAQEPDELARLERLPEPAQAAIAHKITSGAAASIPEAKRQFTREQALAQPARPVYPDCLIECLDNIAHIADDSVDLILTDPPYNVSGESGKVTKIGGDTVSADFDGDDTWDSMERTEFLVQLQAWIEEWARVLRPGGSVVSFCSRSDVSFLWDYYRVYELTPKNTIVWARPNPSPAGLARRNLKSATDFCVWAVKPGAAHTFNESLAWDRSTVIIAPTAGNGERVGHPTQKPLAVLLPMIEVFSNPGDLVLDPFAGSGSTGAAAVQLGRRAHMIERREDYCQLARQRLQDAPYNFPLFT